MIGNPPYIGFHGFKEHKDYLKKNYLSAEGKFDFYLPFIEKGIKLLGKQGILGFICPTNFTKRGHGQGLRSYLRISTKIIEICDFEDVQIFKGALNYTGIFIFQKSDPGNDNELVYKQRSLSEKGYKVIQSRLTDDAWIFRDNVTNDFVEKIKRQKIMPLGEITRGICEGIVTGENSVFLLTQAQIINLKLERDILRPCIRGRQIRRYWLEDINEFVIYPYELVNGKTKAIPEKNLKQYQNQYSYLVSKRKDLSGRPYFEASSKQWYELWCQRDMAFLSLPKIVVAELAESNRFAMADEKHFYGDTACGISLLPSVKLNLIYVLGILNSKLMTFYYQRTTVPKANRYFIYKTMFLKDLPIRIINFADKDERILHDSMVELVETMLELHKRKAVAKVPADREALERQIAATDAEIDRLVYELYGLKNEEINKVEEEAQCL